MKQQDLAIIIVVAFLSGLVAFFVSGKVFSPSKKSQSVPVVPIISSSFNNQSLSQYFTPQSVDPTLPITIGPNANQNPFSNPGSNQ